MNTALDRCPLVRDHSLLHCSLAVQNTEARTSFLGLRPVASKLGAVTSGSLCYPPASALQIPVMWMHKQAHTEFTQIEGF